jgi:hypothetical protein
LRGLGNDDQGRSPFDSLSRKASKSSARTDWAISCCSLFVQSGCGDTCSAVGWRKSDPRRRHDHLPGAVPNPSAYPSQQPCKLVQGDDLGAAVVFQAE